MLLLSAADVCVGDNQVLVWCHDSWDPVKVLVLLTCFFQFTACFLVSSYGEQHILEIVYWILQRQANLGQSSADPAYLNDRHPDDPLSAWVKNVKTEREAAERWKAN